MRNVCYFSFLIFLSFSLRSFALENCQRILYRMLERLPPESTRHYKSNEPHTMRRLPNVPALTPLLKPNFRATVYNNGNIDFSVVSVNAFAEMLKATEGKGFWVIFLPAKEEDRNPAGHVSLAVNNTYFTGQYAMQSYGQMQALLAQPEVMNQFGAYAVAQFIELSDTGTASLNKFMHDRVWGYHSGDPAYRSVYASLPFSRDSKIECGENCITSNLSFLEKKWVQKYPDLSHVLEDLGEFSVSEVPNRQVWLNTQTPAYRGTVIISRTPEEATTWITQGDFNASHTGKQLLFDGKPEKIR